MKGEEIHVIISDLKMPVMNGMEFIEEIKRSSPEKIYHGVTNHIL